MRVCPSDSGSTDGGRPGWSLSRPSPLSRATIQRDRPLALSSLRSGDPLRSTVANLVSLLGDLRNVEGRFEPERPKPVGVFRVTPHCFASEPIRSRTRKPSQKLPSVQPRWQAETPRELRRSFALSGLCDRSTVLPRPLGLLEATFVAPIHLEPVARSRGGDGSVLDRLRRRCRRVRPSPGPWPGSASQRHSPVMTGHPRACRVGPSAVPARWRTGEASSPRSLDQWPANALVSQWLMGNRQGTSPLETSSTESRPDFSRGLHCFREGRHRKPQTRNYSRVVLVTPLPYSRHR